MIKLIIAEVGSSCDITERNTLLCPLALVSTQFRDPVYDVLYGDLRVDWIASVITKLVKSFKKNRQLLKLVRRLEASAPTEEDVARRIHAYIDEVTEDPERVDQFVDDYCEESGLEMEDQDWDSVLGEWKESEELWAEAEDAQPDDAWADREDNSGVHELLVVLEKMTNLRTLIVHGFDATSKDVQADIARRGSFASITTFSPFPVSPEDPPQDEFTSDPFHPDPESFAASLVARMPNLRRLRGILRDEAGLQPQTLPPLHHLEITYTSANKSTFVDIITSVQPTLRSLRVTVRDEGWAVALAPCLAAASVDHFTLDEELFGRYAFEDDFAVLSAALPSSTIRHLIFNLPKIPLTTFACLPAGLRSLSLCWEKSAHYEPCAQLESVLASLTVFPGRPVRINVQVGHGTTTRAWEEWGDRFEAEGLELVFRTPIWDRSSL